MKLKTMPKEVAAELLVYVAEREEFKNVAASLEGEFSPQEIKALLREVAFELQKELQQEGRDVLEKGQASHLTDKTKKIISYLSPHEEKTLLSGFGLIESREK